MTVEFIWPYAEQQRVRQAITIVGIRGISDLRPVWQRFSGTLRQRHRQTFDARVDPITGTPWAPVLPTYDASKPAGKRGKTLEFTGRMRKALTVGKAPWSHFLSQPKRMEYGINAPQIYPLVHQTTARTRRDGAPLNRRFVGMKLPDDLITLQKFIKTHLIGLWAKAGGKTKG